MGLRSLTFTLCLLIVGTSFFGSTYADCADAISPLGASSGDLFNWPPPDRTQRVRKPKSVKSEDAPRPPAREPDRVELSHYVLLYSQHRAAYAEIGILNPPVPKAQVLDVALKKLRGYQEELADPDLRDSEDIRAILGRILDLKRAYQVLVQAGLADPHPDLRE